MIKFNQYLMEDENEKELKKLKKYMIKIKKECQPYLKAIGNDTMKYQMFRGVKKSKKIVFKMKVRKDRRPLDTALDIHKLLDDAMYKHHKIRGRSQCLFATGSKGDAAVYGEPYMIFPIGSFKFLWSPKIRDFSYAMDYLKDLPNYKNVIKNKTVKEYQTTDLKKAIKSEKEIMIDCKEYYLIEHKSFDTMMKLK